MIRKSVISLLVLLSIGSSLYAMEDKTIKIPSAKALRTCFDDAGLEYFVEKTKIDEKLGGRDLSPSGAAFAVEMHLHDFNKDMKNPGVAFMMQMYKQDMIECIMKDAPQETTKALIKQLKDRGALK